MKYPGLTPSVNARPRWEHIDHDYIDQLSNEEKQWLSNFNEEWLSGNFKHKGKKFHKTKKEKRACYSRNNSRNRDVMSLYRNTGWVETIPEYIEGNPASQEDAVIGLLDASNELKKK